MKLLWVSNAPTVGSGYGVQTDLFTRKAVACGHDVFIRAFYGVRGETLRDEVGRIILPGSFTDNAEDVIPLDYKYLRPDATIVLYDSWTFNPEILRRTPIGLYAPVDHHPIPPAVVSRLQAARHVWAMSRHGEREMRKMGIDPLYVPHGVDTTVYAPIDRTEARNVLGFKDQFIAVTTAANKGFPDRKGLRPLLKAWAKFVETRPNAILYVHSNSMAVNSGLDLQSVAEFYGIRKQNIKFADTYKLINGEYKPNFLNALYNAADVFVLPSSGEGFGVPIIDAQASGCPVIVPDVTAMTELCGSGWLLDVDMFDDMEYTLQGSEQAHIRPSLVLEGLEMAYEARNDAAMRSAAREFALDYDINRVWDLFACPALVSMAQRDEEIRKQWRLI